MQVVRQSFAVAMQRAAMFARPSAIVQQVRFEGSDPRSSTSSGNHKGGSDLNKSKGGDKKQRVTKTDDTQQPGASRSDWSQPNKIVGNDPSYGKAGKASDMRNPDSGKN